MENMCKWFSQVYGFIYGSTWIDTQLVKLIEKYAKTIITKEQTAFN